MPARNDGSCLETVVNGPEPRIKEETGRPTNRLPQAGKRGKLKKCGALPGSGSCSCGCSVLDPAPAASTWPGYLVCSGSCKAPNGVVRNGADPLEDGERIWGMGMGGMVTLKMMPVVRRGNDERPDSHWVLQ